MSARVRFALLGCLGLLVGTLAVPALLGLEHASHSTLLAAYVAAFLPYACALFLLRPEGAASRSPRLVLGMLVTCALLIRVMCMACEPVWSDDIYRYVWDGRVAAAGINPFMHAPSAEALAHVRDEAIWPLVNHPHISTIYPPVAQALFLLTAWLGGGTTLLRALLLLVEAAVVYGVWRMGRADAAFRRRGLWAFALYALNPTVCVELAWSGHLDVLAYGPLTLAVMAWTRQGDRPGVRQVCASAVMLGVSVAAKMLPIVLLPLWVGAPRGHGVSWRSVIARRAAVIMIVCGVVAGSYLPYVDAGSQLFAGFGTYASTWRGNDGAFRALMTLSAQSFRAWAPAELHDDPGDPESKALVTLHGAESFYLERGWTKTWQGETLADHTYAEDQIAQAVAKLNVAALLGLVMLWALRVTRDVRVGALMVLTALFFLSPTVYPWYVAWLVALAAIQQRTMWAPIVFSATSLTAYSALLMVASTGQWEVPWWGVGAGALCVGVAMCWDVWHMHDSQREAAVDVAS